MDYLPTAYVFSNINVLSIFLVKELLTKSCRIVIVTNHKDEFEKYFPKNENLIFKDFRENTNEIPSYIFLIQGFGADGFFSKATLGAILNFSETYTPKTQVILPYVLNSTNRKMVEHVSDEAAKTNNSSLNTIYLGEIYGAGMDLFNFTWTSSLFRNMWEGSSLLIPSYDMELYLIDINQAISTLIKGIFSYGFAKKEIVIAFKKSAFSYLRSLQEVAGDLSFVSSEKITQPSTASNFNFLEVYEDKNTISETVAWVLKNKTKFKERKRRRILTPSFSSAHYLLKLTRSAFRYRARRHVKKAGIILLIIGVILSLPFLSFLISSFTLKMGFQKLNQFDLKSANTYFI